MDSVLLYEKPSPIDISHHGIKGQTKGVRNGPPYPLGASQISSGEKKAGSKVSESAKERDGTPSSKKEGAVKRVSKSKKIAKISDDDLSASISRFEKEKRYKELMRDIYGDPDKEYAKSLMKRTHADVAATIAKNIETKVGIALSTKGVNALYKLITGDEHDLIGTSADSSDGIDKAIHIIWEKAKMAGKQTSEAIDKAKKDVEETEKKDDNTSRSKSKKQDTNARKDNAQYLLPDKSKSKKQDYTDAEYKEIWSGTVEGSDSKTRDAGRSYYSRYAHQTMVYADQYIDVGEDNARYLLPDKSR